MNTTTKKAANSIVGKLTAGILATAAVAAAALPAAASAPGSALVIGDSLEVGSGPYLRELLPSVEIDADKGRPSGIGVSVLGSRLSAGHEVVVFPLGTNDSSPDALAASLASAAELAGPRCLVVATIARPPLGGATADQMNRVVGEFAARAGAQVMDWAAVVDALPGLLSPDRVHATGEGYELRAGLMAEAVQGCGAGAGGGDLTGLPAPRDPNAKPPPRLPAETRAVAVPVPVGALFDGAATVVGAVAKALVTATRKPTAEPVLGGEPGLGGEPVLGDEP
jgi:hypothetical protein